MSTTGIKRFREALKKNEEKSSGADTSVIKETVDTSINSPTESDNAAIVNSTSSPCSKSSDQLEERDSPAPDTDLLRAEGLVLLDCQASKPAESLESLIGTLRDQIRSSDWLEKNTPELSAGEDPEILDVFKALLHRARK